jgi:hypothetical protein
MAERRTLVSVDLDDIACYHAIHGLPAPAPPQRGVVLERCLPRFLELFAALGVRATFFVIGRDLQADLDAGGAGAALLQQALAEGHELGNHSFAHPYDLVTWTPDAIGADLRACDAVLRELGAAPVGFRAPGYTHSRALLEQVHALGYAYDSSALPSPLYWMAKVAAIVFYAMRGRRSQSLVRGVSSFLGRREPFVYADLDLWELPMSVTPWLRLPLIGTTLLSGPRRLAATLRATAERLDHFHFELHGLDLADPDTDDYALTLVRLQPELHHPLPDKLTTLRALLQARGATTLLRDACARASATSQRPR